MFAASSSSRLKRSTAGKDFEENNFLLLNLQGFRAEIIADFLKQRWGCDSKSVVDVNTNEGNVSCRVVVEDGFVFNEEFIYVVNVVLCTVAIMHTTHIKDVQELIKKILNYGSKPMLMVTTSPPDIPPDIPPDTPPDTETDDTESSAIYF
ncbi:hypothetical protein H6P81_008345 [Aristolochia fimbriata]|uniref:Uncharacterized protein n=1 Tax=Aristolochia fimbriata TaxID=158543 RepID=A0AAV7F5N5_ARIFI|nr:hypothetical protein H6P81_008345 [Aristolochia fimbriata]